VLKELTLQNFTAFGKAQLKFSSHLNVIVGENASGKTHILKLGYLLCRISHTKSGGNNGAGKEEMERYIAERLLQLFKPEKIGNLARGNGQATCKVSGRIMSTPAQANIEATGKWRSEEATQGLSWRFQFSTRSQKNVSISAVPDGLANNATYPNAIYLPSKEMLSFFEGFLSLYETHELQFDESFRDLALALSSPKLKHRPELSPGLLDELSKAVGGRVVLEGGRFYTIAPKDKKREVSLLAEGLRKVATIVQLVENGSLRPGDSLFWDEPEANLNPKLVKLVTRTLLQLCRSGVQVILATHSLFLLRELEIQTAMQGTDLISTRYVALRPGGTGVKVSQGDSIDDIDPLLVLDESLQQSDRFIAMDDGDA